MDTETTLMFVTCFGITAALCMVVVLRSWLMYRRLPRVAGGWAAAAAAVVVLSLLVAEPRYGVLGSVPESVRPETPPEYGVLRRIPKSRRAGRPRSPAAREPEYRTSRYNTRRHRSAEQARVDEMHRSISPALEQYRAAHGVYPSTLQAAGVGTPLTRYGPLYYYGTGPRDSTWYLLSFGDIERHRFSADWDSRTRKWTIISYDF